MQKRKAIALFSGGLDSTLAMKLMIDQGIEVLACNINTGFGATRDRREHMQNMCDQVGAELKIIDIQSEYLQKVLFSPKHGYGKHFNPCIDCHAKMFEVAKRIMEGEGADFLISGEVLGQRPMSQNGDALNTVLNEANVNGLLLRPMSAQRLEPTIAETEGWVDRDKLEGIQGRSRDRQMELVEEFGRRLGMASLADDGLELGLEFVGVHARRAASEVQLDARRMSERDLIVEILIDVLDGVVAATTHACFLRIAFVCSHA